jgi:hypothetical protein
MIALLGKVTIIVWEAIFLFAMMSILAVRAIQPLNQFVLSFFYEGEVGVA